MNPIHAALAAGTMASIVMLWSDADDFSIWGGIGVAFGLAFVAACIYLPAWA